MLTVNTNTGAMIALQNLTKTNEDLETTQNRINTGLTVAGAKDNGAIFAIAQNMRGTRFPNPWIARRRRSTWRFPPVRRFRTCSSR